MFDCSNLIVWLRLNLLMMNLLMFNLFFNLFLMNIVMSLECVTTSLFALRRVDLVLHLTFDACFSFALSFFDRACASIGLCCLLVHLSLTIEVRRRVENFESIFLYKVFKVLKLSLNLQYYLDCLGGSDRLFCW